MSEPTDVPSELHRYHFGRSWKGHVIEDDCPCEKAPCGLAVVNRGVYCDEHNPKIPIYAKTMRQIHIDSDCPGFDLL